MDAPTLFVLIIDGSPDSLVMAKSDAEAKRLADQVLGVYDSIETKAAAAEDWAGWKAYLSIVGNGYLKTPLISVKAAKACLVRYG